MPFPNKDTQFKPGQSGNPNGHPMGRKSWATVAKEMLEDPDLVIDVITYAKQGKGKKKKNVKHVEKYKYPAKAISMVLVQRAIAGDVSAAKALKDITYGNKVELTTKLDKVAELVDSLDDQEEAWAANLDSKDKAKDGSVIRDNTEDQAVEDEPPLQDQE